GQAPDFSKEQPHKSFGPQVSFTLDRKPWEERVRAYTKSFRESPAILNSIVTFSALAQNVFQVNTEGTQLQFGQIRYRLELFIQGKAPDGMNIERYYNFDWVDPKDAPDDKAVAVASATLRKEMEGLGATPVSRQGNLIVESNKMVTNAELRAKLIELVKQQGKPYGLLIDDIAGGFTFTGRGQPQAFQVQPLVVYKVFADGRPDELVR